ncbi:hypothetical protein ALC53_04738 [Atta colombica]|uniref:Uncharacterized protein n=1 Tax=Atta colombica TaxID=520822 RepID=A0A195BL48_9HYME|nr:hypothetical protein ALC53_04738 [Atta colombica]
MNFVGDGYYKLNRHLLLLVGLWPTNENSIYKYCQMILCNILIIFTMICQIRYLMDRVEEDWNMLKDKKELEIIERYTCIGSMSFNDKLLQGYTSEKQAIIIYKRIIEAVHIHKKALEYITRWQGAPIQAQKLLPIIMQRSLRSCKMIVGGMFVPSLEGFATKPVHVLFKLLLWYCKDYMHLDYLKLLVDAGGMFSLCLEGKYYKKVVEEKKNDRNHIIEFRERVQSNWNALKDNQEIKIICKYGNNGKLLTIFITIIKSKFWASLFNHICDGYNIQWYIAPLKVQKLLLFVMRKSMRCCTLMIGGLFIPSLEGFATVKS